MIVHWDTIITGLISAAILWGVRTMTKVIKNYGAESRAWRSGITNRLNDMEGKLDELEKKQNRSISQQAVQIRSDIVHKCHRYLDDLGRASSEEKETLNDAYEKYCEFCEDLDMENDFIDLLVQRVMELPEREV